jgi:hypothetical protein
MKFLFGHLRLFLLISMITGSAHAADIEITETLQLPECHSLGWVRANAGVKGQGAGNLILDEAKWGTPAANQVIEQHWDWDLSDAQWAEVVKQKGEDKKEDVKFDLWMPESIGTARGIVVISGHGSGETLYKHAELRKIARELHLAIFKFVGNPMQRGFWPRSLLDQRIAAFAEKSQHPELKHAPLFLYGHSNGTGFSAIYPAVEDSRVWAWVSMRPGTTFQVYQPNAAQIPGMIIFGEDDPFFARPSKEQNMAVVEAMRQKHARTLALRRRAEDRSRPRRENLASRLLLPAPQLRRTHPCCR